MEVQRVAEVLFWVVLAVSAEGVCCAEDSADRTDNGEERGSNSKLAVKVEVGATISVTITYRKVLSIGGTIKGDLELRFQPHTMAHTKCRVLDFSPGKKCS